MIKVLALQRIQNIRIGNKKDDRLLEGLFVSLSGDKIKIDCKM